MPLSFAIFEERSDVIIVEASAVSHGNRSDAELAAARFFLLLQQRHAQEIIERVPE
jgi:hypothetical protein